MTTLEIAQPRRRNDHPKLRIAIRRLLHIRIHTIVLVFFFWVIQLFAWVCMMAYVQFFNPKLGDNVLYVTQISHWALVITCGTAATATWGVMSTRVHHRDAQVQWAAREMDTEQIELDLAALAKLQPGPESDQLATTILSRIKTPTTGPTQ